jgi:hypothetical protein
MIKVNIEEVKEIQEKRKVINSIKFEEIELYENGEKIEVNQYVKDNWKYTGLDNMTFIAGEFYKEEDMGG